MLTFAFRHGLWVPQANLSYSEHVGLSTLTIKIIEQNAIELVCDLCFGGNQKFLTNCFKHTKNMLTWRINIFQKQKIFFLLHLRKPIWNIKFIIWSHLRWQFQIFARNGFLFCCMLILLPLNWYRKWEAELQSPQMISHEFILSSLSNMERIHPLFPIRFLSLADKRLSIRHLALLLVLLPQPNGSGHLTWHFSPSMGLPVQSALGCPKAQSSTKVSNQNPE